MNNIRQQIASVLTPNLKRETIGHIFIGVGPLVVEKVRKEFNIMFVLYMFNHTISFDVPKQMGGSFKYNVV